MATVASLVVNSLSILSVSVAIHMLWETRYEKTIAGDSKYFQTLLFIIIAFYHTAIIVTVVSTAFFTIRNDVATGLYAVRYFFGAMASFTGTCWVVCLWHICIQSLEKCMFKNTRHFLVKHGRLQWILRVWTVLYLTCTLAVYLMGLVRCQCHSSFLVLKMMNNLALLPYNIIAIPIVMDLGRIIVSVRLLKQDFKRAQVNLQPLIVLTVAIIVLWFLTLLGYIPAIIEWSRERISFDDVCSVNDTCSQSRVYTASDKTSSLIYSPVGILVAFPTFNKLAMKMVRHRQASYTGFYLF